MARLAGCSIADVQKDRLGVARKFAREHELIVVLKGQPHAGGSAEWRSLGQYDGQSGNVNRRHGRHSHRHGCGHDRATPNDVLLAVCAAVHLHGLAGDVMRESVGEHSMVATDLLRGLPEAFDARREPRRRSSLVGTAESNPRMPWKSGPFRAAFGVGHAEGLSAPGGRLSVASESSPGLKPDRLNVPFAALKGRSSTGSFTSAGFHRKRDLAQEAYLEAASRWFFLPPPNAALRRGSRSP